MHVVEDQILCSSALGSAVKEVRNEMHGLLEFSMGPNGKDVTIKMTKEENLLPEYTSTTSVPSFTTAAPTPAMDEENDEPRTDFLRIEDEAKGGYWADGEDGADGAEEETHPLNVRVIQPREVEELPTMEWGDDEDDMGESLRGKRYAPESPDRYPKISIRKILPIVEKKKGTAQVKEPAKFKEKEPPKPLVVKKFNGLQVDEGAKIVQPDLLFGRVLLHVVDKVILPEVEQ